MSTSAFWSTILVVVVATLTASFIERQLGWR